MSPTGALAAGPSWRPRRLILGVRLRGRLLWVPEKKMTGSTGRMHGEMPVISPPMKPIAISVVMSGTSEPRSVRIDSVRQRH